MGKYSPSAEQMREHQSEKQPSLSSMPKEELIALEQKAVEKRDYLQAQKIKEQLDVIEAQEKENEALRIHEEHQQEMQTLQAKADIEKKEKMSELMSQFEDKTENSNENNENIDEGIDKRTHNMVKGVFSKVTLQIQKHGSSKDKYNMKNYVQFVRELDGLQ